MQLAGGQLEQRSHPAIGVDPQHLQVFTTVGSATLAGKTVRIVDVGFDRAGIARLDVGHIRANRDDLDTTNRWPVLLGTQIPFEIDGADIVLVDDVLFTGRTVRAALNTICDLGRPARVRLAVLVDRGHREIPIQADIVGLSLQTRREQRVKARVKPIDATDEVLKVG